MVYICTPNHLHFEHIQNALRHGKHVLCEKPLVANAQQLKECFQLARSSNPVSYTHLPMIAVIVKISNALSQKHPRIYKYSMIAFIGMLLAISLFFVVIKHQMSFLVIVACLAITLCDTIKNR